MTEDLWRLTACSAVDLLKKGELAPDDLIDAAEARIAATNPAVNALPTLCFDRARHKAGSVDKASLLAGLPVAIKDYNDVEGVKTTFGSAVFADNVPPRSEHQVLRIEARGGVVIGKSNVPEFAGANTFNPVFGATRNPWDTRMSAAGSSGGAAAALAAGMVWLAQGNDLGGSLRTPAGFNGVVGLRPGPGRTVRGPTDVPFDTLWVEGPMARTVEDAGLFLDVLTGAHPDDPLAMPEPERPFRAAAAAPKPPKRIGWSPDLGICAVDPEVAQVCRAALDRFAGTGVELTEDCPNFREAYEAFMVLRALMLANKYGPLLETHRDTIKPDIVWNVEKGLALSADEIGRAERARGRLVHAMSGFFGKHDVLACPVAPCSPFPVEQNYIDEIAGQKLDTYVDWITITFAITLTACPVLSIPVGFDATGMPVGIQLVGRPRGEAELLAAGAALEAFVGIKDKLPVEPNVTHESDGLETQKRA